MQFFVWLEHTAFSSWVRESSSLLAYPGVLFLHTVGLGILVGINAAIDLRILGVASEIPLRVLDRFFPLMWVGFYINAVSGTVLLIIDATTKLSSPVFYIKLLLIAFAVVNMVMIRNRVFRDPLLDKRPVQLNGKILAWTSLFLWTGAITAGRLMAYLGPVGENLKK
jgi:hypothetical protein